MMNEKWKGGITALIVTTQMGFGIKANTNDIVPFDTCLKMRPWGGYENYGCDEKVVFLEKEAK